MITICCVCSNPCKSNFVIWLAPPICHRACLILESHAQLPDNRGRGRLFGHLLNDHGVIQCVNDKPLLRQGHIPPLRVKKNYLPPVQGSPVAVVKHVQSTDGRCFAYIRWELRMLKCPIRHLRQQNHPLTKQTDYMRLCAHLEAACRLRAFPPRAILCWQPVPIHADHPFLSTHTLPRPHLFLPTVSRDQTFSTYSPSHPHLSTNPPL